MKIKLSNEKLQYLSLFEDITGITPKDCVDSGNGDHLTFVIDSEDMGRAIGENGRNINKVREKMDKKVDIVEYSDDPEEFLRNIFSPIEIREIDFEEKEGKKSARIRVKQSEKGRAVGKDGWNIKRARKLSDRHHGLVDVTFV